MGKDLSGNELGQGIMQRANGRYEARFVDRFGKRKSISGRSLKEVKQKFNEQVYENDKQINVKEDITLDEWYQKWMNVYKFNIIRENTKMYYNRVYFKHISPRIGMFYIKDITQIQIKEIINNLYKDGYQFETLNKVKIILSDMFTKAMNNEYVSKNPTRGVIIPCKKENRIKVLSQENQSAFFDCCKGTFYDNFFNVAVSTGMRVGELAALTWDDIDLVNKTIHVSRTLVYQEYENDDCKTFHIELPKTKTSDRVIPINKQCESALKKQYMQKRVVAEKAPVEKKCDEQFKDLLFTTKYNTPLNAQIVADAIKRIIDEINLMRDTTEELETFSSHCFRHTFATRCFEAGIKPKTVQAFLGHATLQMTMDLYTTVMPQEKSNEMGKLDTELEKISTLGDDILEEKFSKVSTNNIIPMVI